MFLENGQIISAEEYLGSLGDKGNHLIDIANLVNSLGGSSFDGSTRLHDLRYPEQETKKDPFSETRRTWLSIITQLSSRDRYLIGLSLGTCMRQSYMGGLGLRKETLR